MILAGALVRAGALIRAAHAGPTIAVTGFAVVWAALGAGLPPSTLVLVAAAVLTGQLSIGWCNDWADADRDTFAARADKPVAAGQVSRREVGLAAVIALASCVVLSLSLGLAAGVVHLIAVASGLAYDLRLKSTLASPLPYAVSFGLLPAVATLAAPDPVWPAVPVIVAGALLGVAAHLANTLGDTEDDLTTGVRGLPQRVGPSASALGAGLVVALAALVLLPSVIGSGSGGGSAAGAGGWSAARALLATVLLGGGVVLGVLAAVRVLTGNGMPGRPVGRGAFWLVVGAAGLVVLGFVLA